MKMRGLWLVTLLIVVLLVWLASILLSGVLHRSGWTSPAYVLPGAVLAWIVLDLAFGVLLYTWATFVPDDPNA